MKKEFTRQERNHPLKTDTYTGADVFWFCHSVVSSSACFINADLRSGDIHFCFSIAAFNSLSASVSGKKKYGVNGNDPNSETTLSSANPSHFSSHMNFSITGCSFPYFFMISENGSLGT
jgi:hypothetical protein